MIKYLENVKLGLLEPLSLMYAESTKRSYSLELSKHRDVERVHSGGVNAIDIETIEGRYVLSGGSNGALYIHDLDNLTGQPQYTCRTICKIDSKSEYAHQHSVETVQWYPSDTGIFTSSGMDRQLRIWDTNTMKPADSYQLEGRIYQHHMSPIATKHCLIAVGSSSSQVVLVDLKSGSATHELRGHRSTVLTVRWSTRNEYLLASGSCDNRILLWDVRSARGFLQSLDQHNGVADGSSAQSSTAHNGHVNGLCFTQNGLFLVSFGTDNRLRLWNTFTGHKEIVNFGKIPNESKRAIRFDVSHNCIPDLVYVPSEGNILAYDLHLGFKVKTLLGHYNSVNCCTFHPFHQELYSGANDRNLLIWTPDGEQTRAYDEYLRTKSQESKRSTTAISLRNVTADTWSSDED